MSNLIPTKGDKMQKSKETLQEFIQRINDDPNIKTINSEILDIIREKAITANAGKPVDFKLSEASKRSIKRSIVSFVAFGIGVALKGSIGVDIPPDITALIVGAGITAIYTVGENFFRFGLPRK
jgi:hypothetical protein